MPDILQNIAGTGLIVGNPVLRKFFRNRPGGADVGPMLSKPKPLMSNGLVLVVEDSAAQAGQLRSLLEGAKLEVAVAMNGVDALDLLDLRQTALIISDIVMPVMDGYELCRRVKASKKFRQIPFMLLTSLAQPQDIFQGLESGADYYNVKPYDGVVLMNRVRTVLDGLSRRQQGDLSESMDISYAGQKYSISADRSQILDLLLATFESTVRKNSELTLANKKLSDALESNKTLRGLIPICSYCKKIRDDRGYWEKVESFISKHSDARFSHGVCPHCLSKALEEVENLGKDAGPSKS